MSEEGGGPPTCGPCPLPRRRQRGRRRGSSTTAAGLTPPHARGGSRFISDVIVELGLRPRERVDAAVEEAKASGKTPEQVLVEAGRADAATSSRARPPSASACTTST